MKWSQPNRSQLPVLLLEPGVRWKKMRTLRTRRRSSKQLTTSDSRSREFPCRRLGCLHCSGAADIPSHPRQIATLVRRPDDARKTKRAARAERKAAEKAQREEGTRALKGEKRREMERQIAVLKRETSAKGADWSKIEEMLEGEWDEAKFESALQGIYEANAEVREV